MNSWKQPTPTDIITNPNLNALDRAVFREILSMCRNENGLIRFEHGNKTYEIELKRGQCIFAKARFARELEIRNGRKRVTKSLRNISKWYTELHIERRPFGMIITMKDYNSIIEMDIKGHIQVTSKSHRSNIEVTPNKSVESVESVKSVDSGKVQFDKRKEEIKKIAQRIADKYNELFNSRIRVTKGKLRQVKNRLEIYTPEELVKAVEKCANNTYYTGHNDRKWIADFDFIFRNDEQVDKMLNIKSDIYRAAGNASVKEEKTEGVASKPQHANPHIAKLEQLAVERKANAGKAKEKASN